MSPMPEDILREINRSVWTIGYTGQSPERLKAHMRNMNVFDVKTLKAKGGKDKETGYDFSRGQELEDRHVRRHHPRGDEEPRLPSLRQCQGARRGLELPRPDSAAPRAAVWHRPDLVGQVPDARRQEGVLAAADPVQERAGEEQATRCTRNSR
jgi:hypothetical protein